MLLSTGAPQVFSWRHTHCLLSTLSVLTFIFCTRNQYSLTKRTSFLLIFYFSFIIISLWFLFSSCFRTHVWLSNCLIHLGVFTAGVIDIELHLPTPANMLAHELTAVISPSPFLGVHKPTHIVNNKNTRRLFDGELEGAEHVLIDDGLLWLAVENGTIYSAERNCEGCEEFGALREEIYVGPGRPLGFSPDGLGGMFICNSLVVRTHSFCFL